jgi:hypothetical protein
MKTAAITAAGAKGIRVFIGTALEKTILQCAPEHRLQEVEFGLTRIPTH